MRIMLFRGLRLVHFFLAANRFDYEQLMDFEAFAEWNLGTG